jgi:hypothetical protein
MLGGLSGWAKRNEFLCYAEEEKLKIERPYIFQFCGEWMR